MVVVNNIKVLLVLESRIFFLNSGDTRSLLLRILLLEEMASKSRSSDLPNDILFLHAGRNACRHVCVSDTLSFEQLRSFCFVNGN